MRVHVAEGDARREQRACGECLCLLRQRGSGFRDQARCALSTFLSDVLSRISDNLGSFARGSFPRHVAKSFMVSCDNAHAVHPNHPEKTDAENCTYLNKGVRHQVQRQPEVYDRRQSARPCSAASANRQGCRCSISRTVRTWRAAARWATSLRSRCRMHTVDIGLAQLAMHSSYETAGIKDTAYMIRGAEQPSTSAICASAAASASRSKHKNGTREEKEGAQGPY